MNILKASNERLIYQYVMDKHEDELNLKEFLIQELKNRKYEFWMEDKLIVNIEVFNIGQAELNLNWIESISKSILECECNVYSWWEANNPFSKPLIIEKK